MRTTLRLALLAAVLSPTMAPSAFAMDVSAIKPHMEVVGEDGGHVGTVDKVEGDQMLLTQDDSAARGAHHQLPVTAVDNVAKDKVTLKASAENAKAAWLTVGQPGDDKPK